MDTIFEVRGQSLYPSTLCLCYVRKKIAISESGGVHLRSHYCRNIFSFLNRFDTTRNIC